MPAAPRPLVLGLRRQDWAFFAWLACAGAAAIALLAGAWTAAAVAALGAVGGVALARRWSRRHPAPMPHALRGILYLAHPGLTPRGLHRILAPRAGERLLEIGPGVGHHALPTAAALGPDGRLDVLDVQPGMLAALTARATAAGRRNLVATAGDAQALPWPDDTFDGAYLVTVLGEVPDPARALRELARVVKPGGRVVVGELVLDPDYVAPGRLAALAADAGLAVRARAGTRLAYFARLAVP